MKSLERRFQKISDKNPNWGSHTCLAEAVKQRHFSEQMIHRWFNKLVEKDDYAKNEKKAVLAYLVALSNPLRTTENEAYSPPQGEQSAR